MASGVAVHPDCQTTFMKMAEGRADYRYIIFKIENGKEIIVERAVTPKDMQTQGDDYEDNSLAAYDEFINELKNLTNGWTDCRYGVFDFKFKTGRQGAGDSRMDKIIFLQICPDSASVKSKMVYASSATTLKNVLGTEKMLQFQISDESDLSHREMQNKLTEKYMQ